MTAPYTTGTVSVSANGTAVTGSGTAFVIQGIKAGDLFTAGGLSVPVASVESNTGLTLAASWPGSTLSGSAYAIVQVADAGALALVNNQRLAEIAARLGAEFYINIYGADNAATGLLADRSTHDAKPQGFAYFTTDTFEVYAKLSNTSADWSSGVSMRGPSGGQGVAGEVGPTGAIGGSFPFAFSSSLTMADPGPGQFRVNNATLTLATQLALAPDLADETNISDFLMARHAGHCRIIIVSEGEYVEFDSDSIARIKSDGSPLGPEESKSLTSYLLLSIGSGLATGTIDDEASCEIVFAPNSAEDAATAAAAAVSAVAAAGAADAAKQAAEAARDDLIGPIDWSQFPPSHFTAPGDRTYRHMTYAGLTDVVYVDSSWRKIVSGPAFSTLVWGEGADIDILPGEASALVLDIENGLVLRRDAVTPANNRFQTIAAAIAEGWLIDEEAGIYRLALTSAPGGVPTEYTLFADCPVPSTAAATQAIIGLGIDGDVNNWSQLRLITSGATPNAFLRSASANVYSGSTTNGTAGIAFKLAARFKANDFNGYLNGVALAAANPDTSGALIVDSDMLRIGAAHSSFSNPYAGSIDKVAYVPRALSNAELAAATA